MAILLTVIALFLILTWNENYGECHEDKKEVIEGSVEQTSQISDFGAMVHSIKSSVSIIHQYPVIFLLGMSQAFFEGAVYTFG